jgi:hypothetical protein
MANPYVNDTPANVNYANEQDFDALGPNSRYAAPSLESGSPYNDEFGWGPKLLSDGIWGTPDAQRLQTFPRRDFYPVDQESFYEQRDADEARRHSVEDQDANGWDEKKGPLKSWARNPRETPPPETRITEKLSPRSYSFLRPFDQLQKGLGERRLNGIHFSMADHRRNYEVTTNFEVRTSRNTYRIDPTPWDTDMADIPPRYEPDTPQFRIQTVDLPPSSSRSWRL